MGYLNNEGLKRYSWNVRNKMASNVQMTKAAPIVQFCPASESDLEPIVNFKFTETLPVEGEKGPDNPSTFNGISSVNVGRIGKNRLTKIADFLWIDLPVVANEDGSYTFNGTITTNSYSARAFTDSSTAFTSTKSSIRLDPTKTYTLSAELVSGSVTLSDPNGSRPAIVYGYSDDSGGALIVHLPLTVGKNSQTTLAKTNDKGEFIVRIQQFQNATFDNAVYRFQLEEGDVATNFEPPLSLNEVNYTLSLNDTYYGGSVNLASGEMTVTWVKETVTSFAEVDAINSNTITLPSWASHVHPNNMSTSIVCNCFETRLGAQDIEHCRFAGLTNGEELYFYINKSRFDVSGAVDPSSPTTAEWKNAANVWLANHPIEVVFILTEPIVVQLDPIQIKALSSPDKYNPTINTVYTDQESVQVGWIREDFIHKSGNETIEGVKTFANVTPGSTAGDSVTDLTIRNPAVVRGVRGEGVNWSRMIFADKEGDTEGNFAGRLGIFEIRSPKTNEYNNNGGEQFRFKCYKYSDNASDYSKSSDIILGYDKDGIAYATAPSTSMDRSVATDIVTRDWLPKDTRIPQKSDLWNWQKTEKGGAVAFKPVPESDLEPVVDFMFTETLPSEGEKGLENPSTITGVSSIHVTRSGKNLLGISSLSLSTSHGITFTPSADGSISISGTYANASAYYTLRDNLYLPAGETLYLSIKEGPHSSLYNAVLQLVAYDANNAEISIIWQRLNANPIPITIPDGVKYRIRLGVFNTLDSSAPVVITPMAELVSLSQEWVPFEDYDLYIIQLGDTYYGGSLDVATGVMMVTKEFVTLNTIHASDGIAEGNAVFRAWPEQLGILKPINNGTEVCEELPRATTGTGVNRFFVGAPVNGNCPIYVVLNPSLLDLSGAVDPSNPTAAEVRSAGIAYLNAHPLHMVLSLEAPYTIQLTPTQIFSLPSLDKYTPRANTIYTDAASVQVGYQRYANEGKNAVSASKLKTSVSLKTNLASTTDIAFDGSTDQNSIPVSGVLSISNGGTGSSTQNFVDLSNSQVINGVKTFGSTIEGLVDRSIKDGSGNVIANTYATKAVATSLADGLMSSTDKSKLDSIGTVFNFKGSVADTASLPGSGNTTGDAYLVQSPLGLQAWNGTSWVDIGSSALLPISDNEIDAVFA